MRRTMMAAVALLVMGGMAHAQQAPRETTREAFMQRAERAAIRRFDRIDADRDGVLSQAERAEDRAKRSAAFQARQAASAARRGNAGSL